MNPLQQEALKTLKIAEANAAALTKDYTLSKAEMLEMVRNQIEMAKVQALLNLADALNLKKD